MSLHACNVSAKIGKILSPYSPIFVNKKIHSVFESGFLCFMNSILKS